MEPDTDAASPAAAPAAPAMDDSSPAVAVASSPSGSATARGLHYDDDDDDGNDDEEAESRTSSRDDVRSHTFRQRRLTYTRHHLGGAAAAAAALAGDLSDGDDDDGEAQAQAAADEKAAQDGTAAAAKEAEHAAKKRDGEPSPASPSPAKKKRRRLEAKIMHATAPPHHMRGEAAHRLYDHHNVECAAHRLAEDEEHAEAAEAEEEEVVVTMVGGRPSTVKKRRKGGELPAWRRRRFIRHSIKEDESLLPFPRHVVGTYSCHGVEPLYDSDYEHDDDEEDVEEDEDHHNDDTGARKTKAQRDEESDDDVQGAAKTAGDQTVAKINQDRGGVAFPYGNCPRTALFAAYDGHGDGGEHVAQYALHEVQRRLEAHPQFSSDVAKAFRDTFVEVDRDLAAVPEVEPLYAGATANVVLLRETALTIANAGDSRAVLARRRRAGPGPGPGGGRQMRLAMDLSVDQNPDSPGEQERIEGAGGFVSPPPEPGLSARVWLDPEYTQIGLAMGRSIGDHAVKPVGVIAEPEITTHELTDEDEFMIIATDGVWEFITSEEAVEVVGRYLDAGEGASRACQCLIEAAAGKWHDIEGEYRDDITALVVVFADIWKDSPKHRLSGLSETS